MTDRDKVTELLKNYRSYKYAVRMFETTGWVAISGTQWSDVPGRGGFGPRAPVKFTADSYQDVLDYQQYKRAVEVIEGALESLTDNEREVIEYKYMRGWTLRMIEMYRHYGTNSTKAIHKRALAKLANCFRFVEVPKIENLDNVKKRQNNDFLTTFNVV